MKKGRKNWRIEELEKWKKGKGEKDRIGIGVIALNICKMGT